MAGQVQPAHVQSASAVNLTASTTSMAPALTGVTAGDTLVLAVSSTTLTSGYVATAVTDTNGATWVRGPSLPSSAGAVEIWYGLNASAGTHTLTVTTNSGTNGCLLDEFSGVATVQPVFDISVTHTASGTGPTASLTPSNVNELLYFATVSANTQTGSPSAPFTAEVGPTLAAAQRAGVAYVAANSLIGAYAPAWTQTTGVYAVVGIALKGASVPGDAIWNDTAAQGNPGILESQARADYFDSITDALAATGTGVLSGCAVSPNTASDFKFQTLAGTVMLNWSAITVAAVTAQSLTTADATNPRRDLVYVTQAGTVVYLAGTANATPSCPSLPANCVALAVIEVPANAATLDNGTSTSNAHVTDKRSLLALPISMRDYYTNTGLYLAETVPRVLVTSAGGSAATGALPFQAIYLTAGMTIGHMTFISGNTPASVPTHWWFALFDLNSNMLAVTADQTTTAWGAATVKTLAIATTAQGAQSTFTTTYSGYYYIGAMMTATTVVSLEGPVSPSQAATWQQGPPYFRRDNVATSQTTPPTFPFNPGIGSAGTIAHWGAVS